MTSKIYIMHQRNQFSIMSKFKSSTMHHIIQLSKEYTIDIRQIRINMKDNQERKLNIISLRKQNLSIIKGKFQLKLRLLNL